MNEETTYIAIPERKRWIEFEENSSMEVNSAFPLTSRLLKNFGTVRSHWAIKIAYYLGIFPIAAVFCGTVDLLIALLVNIPSILKFCFVNLFELVKWIVMQVWNFAGDLLKSFFKKFLAVMGVFLAGYIIYLFFKTGAWVNVWDILKTMFGISDTPTIVMHH